MHVATFHPQRGFIRFLGLLLLSAAAVLGLGACAAGPGPGGVDQTSPAVDSDSSFEYLKRLSTFWADYYGVENPPDVELVRYVSTEEVLSVSTQCLEDEGFAIGTDGGYSYPESAADSFALAQYVCAMKYVVPERYNEEWGQEQVRIQYEWTVEFVIPCLEERGHPISDPPSEATFVDTWATDPFFPFAQVTLGVPSEELNMAWREIEKTCPQQAPGSVLWDAMSIDEWISVNR